ncbi:MAG: S24 family peptidase, partial [Acinetobacter sp.]
GEFYAVYFEGEAMLKQIFKESGGVLALHSLNGKYRDKIISDENGANFRVIGRQFWRAG